MRSSGCQSDNAPSHVQLKHGCLMICTNDAHDSTYVSHTWTPTNKASQASLCITKGQTLQCSSNFGPRAAWLRALVRRASLAAWDIQKYLGLGSQSTVLDVSRVSFYDWLPWGWDSRVDWSVMFICVTRGTFGEMSEFRRAKLYSISVIRLSLTRLFVFIMHS